MTTAALVRQHLRKQALDRARNCCEGSPKYPDCRAEEGYLHPATGKKTTLAVIAMEPGTDNPMLMRVMCSRCVIEYEFPKHKTQDWRKDRAARGNLELFPIEETP